RTSPMSREARIPAATKNAPRLEEAAARAGGSTGAPSGSGALRGEENGFCVTALNLDGNEGHRKRCSLVPGPTHTDATSLGLFAPARHTAALSSVAYGPIRSPPRAASMHRNSLRELASR